MSHLTQFGGSLAAILALAGIAWVMRLGRYELDWSRAMGFAKDHLDLEPLEAVVSADKKAALVVDYETNVAAIKVHGAHLAGRILRSPMTVRKTNTGVSIQTADAWFGEIRLTCVTIEEVRELEARQHRTGS